MDAAIKGKFGGVCILDGRCKVVAIIDAGIQIEDEHGAFAMVDAVSIDMSDVTEVKIGSILQTDGRSYKIVRLLDKSGPFNRYVIA